MKPFTISPNRTMDLRDHANNSQLTILRGNHWICDSSYTLFFIMFYAWLKLCGTFFHGKNCLPSLKLTCPLKICLSNRKVGFQPSIFNGYVSFREGICPCFWQRRGPPPSATHWAVTRHQYQIPGHFMAW